MSDVINRIYYIDGKRVSTEKRNPGIGEDVVVTKVSEEFVSPTICTVISDGAASVFVIDAEIHGTDVLYYDDTDVDVYYVVTSVEEVGGDVVDIEEDTDSNEEPAEDGADNVNHPQHYTQGNVEVIDYIDQVADGYPGRQAVYAANIIKYVSRAPYKNGVEDVKKAIWYAQRLADDMTREMEAEGKAES